MKYENTKSVQSLIGVTTLNPNIFLRRVLKLFKTISDFIARHVELLRKRRKK